MLRLKTYQISKNFNRKRQYSLILWINRFHDLYQMEKYSLKFQTRWSDMDPNGHMRHTAYNDYAAQVRVMIFDELSYPMSQMVKNGIGPVLFREEVKFYQEIRLNDKIEVDFLLLRARKNASKYSIQHRIFNSKFELSALVTVDGAWLDLKTRKVVVPPQQLISAVDQMPRSENFQWLPDKVKKDR